MYVENTKNQIIREDVNIRHVLLENGKMGCAALTRKGLIEMAKLEMNGYLCGFTITRLADGIPFMAIEK